MSNQLSPWLHVGKCPPPPPSCPLHVGCVWGLFNDNLAYRVDEVASDVAHEDARGQQSILEGQCIDLERHIVDVYEVDTQGGSHADAAWAET